MKPFPPPTVRSRTNLVELDFLRGGDLLPTVREYPAGDYFAFVTRPTKWPIVYVYPWMLRDPLPTITMPLKGDDPDVPLDLQVVFQTVYERARYDLSINYAAPLVPPLRETDAQWMNRILER